MATAFSEVICNYFLTMVDDERVTQEMAENPARAMRRQAINLTAAVPMFTRPPEMLEWLAYTPANYDDYLYTAESAQTAPFVIPTEMVGYAMCNAVLIGLDAAGNVVNTPIQSTYDPETGEVTLQSDLAEGQQVDIDFYTDGEFANTLNDDQKDVLATCMAVKWFGKFSNTWLNMTPKIKDKSSDTGSESAQMTANTARLKEARLALADKLLRFEENCVYRQKMPTGLKLKTPFPRGG